MIAENYEQILAALTGIISPFDFTDDITKTKLTIDNRTVNLPTLFKDIVVEGDANSKTITFTISRHYDGVDRSDKTIVIKYINALGQGDWYKVEDEDIVIDEEYIQFIWLINERATAKQGNVNYIIEFSGFRDDEKLIPYYWHTNPSYFSVNKGLDVDDHIISEFPSLLQNHEIRISTLEKNGVSPSDIDDLISIDTNNAITKGTDEKLFVSKVELSEQRDFTINPINLTTEVTGTVPVDNIDTASLWGSF